MRTLDKYYTLTDEEEKQKCMKIIQILVSHESKQIDSHGNTALIMAAEKQDFDLIKIIAPYEIRM